MALFGFATILDGNNETMTDYAWDTPTGTWAKSLVNSIWRFGAAFAGSGLDRRWWFHGHLNKSLRPSGTVVWFAVLFRGSANPAANERFLAIQGVLPVSSQIILEWRTADNKINMYDGNLVLKATSTNAMSSAADHWLVIKADRTGANIVYTLWVDGTQEISAIVDSAPPLNPYIMQIGGFQGKGINPNNSLYYAYATINDESGSDEWTGSPPQPLRCDLYAPNLDGALEEMTGTPDATNQYTNWDEATNDGDTTKNYVAAATAGPKRTTSTVPASTIDPTVEHIGAVVALPMGQFTGSAVGADQVAAGYAAVLRQGGVNYDGVWDDANKTPVPSYIITKGGYVASRQPNGGAVWTKTARNAGIEIGAGKTGTGVLTGCDFTRVWLMEIVLSGAEPAPPAGQPTMRRWGGVPHMGGQLTGRRNW